MLRRVCLQAFDAARMLMLGHTDQGLPLAAAILDETTNPGRRARLLGDLCAGWTRAGNPQAACATGIAALYEAQPAGFTIAIYHIRKARAGFDPRWANLSCVTELDERLAAVT